jgi:hypothetical protein
MDLIVRVVHQVELSIMLGYVLVQIIHYMMIRIHWNVRTVLGIIFVRLVLGLGFVRPVMSIIILLLIRY